MRPPLPECTGALILSLAAGWTARRWWPALERAEGRLSLAVERRMQRQAARRHRDLHGYGLSAQQRRARIIAATQDAPVIDRRERYLRTVESMNPDPVLQERINELREAMKEKP